MTEKYHEWSSNTYAFKNICGCDVATSSPTKNKDQWFSKYGYGSFANDPMCDECVNARIISCPEHDYAAYVVCCKDIPTGNEIFLSYGKLFWDSLIDPTNPIKGTRLQNVERSYGGYCDLHSDPTFQDKEEDLKDLYS